MFIIMLRCFGGEQEEVRAKEWIGEEKVEDTIKRGGGSEGEGGRLRGGGGCSGRVCWGRWTWRRESGAWEAYA